MAVNRTILTLDEFRSMETRKLPQATGGLSNLLRDIGLGAKRINVEANKAGLVDILGDARTVNIQDEEVKKLDEYANTEFINVLKRGTSCAGVLYFKPVFCSNSNTCMGVSRCRVFQKR